MKESGEGGVGLHLVFIQQVKLDDALEHQCSVLNLPCIIVTRII